MCVKVQLSFPQEAQAAGIYVREALSDFTQKISRSYWPVVIVAAVQWHNVEGICEEQTSQLWSITAEQPSEKRQIQ